MKTAEEIAFDLASAATDMMTLHSPHTESMMCDAIARWKKWQMQRKARKVHDADTAKGIADPSALACARKTDVPPVVLSLSLEP